jgi:hypothetical protein
MSAFLPKEGASVGETPEESTCRPGRRLAITLHLPNEGGRVPVSVDQLSVKRLGRDPNSVGYIGEFQLAEKVEQGRLVKSYRVLCPCREIFSEFSPTITQWLFTSTIRRGGTGEITPPPGTSPNGHDRDSSVQPHRVDFPPQKSSTEVLKESKPMSVGTGVSRGSPAGPPRSPNAPLNPSPGEPSNAARSSSLLRAPMAAFRSSYRRCHLYVQQTPSLTIRLRLATHTDGRIDYDFDS